MHGVQLSRSLFLVWFCWCKGVATFKVFNIFWVLLMHGDLTCWKFLKYFVSMLMYGGTKLKALQVFSGFYWWMGATTHKLHHLCGCVDVWRLLTLINFLWLCQHLKLLVCLVVLIWGRTNEDVLVASCRNEILCANGNEKNHSLLMFRPLDYDLWNVFYGQYHIINWKLYIHVNICIKKLFIISSF